MERRESYRQRVVFAQARHSHLMEGDSLPDATYDGGALPSLMQAGWRISHAVTGPSGVYFIMTHESDSGTAGGSSGT
jgi:hypothetical protein